MEILLGLGYLLLLSNLEQTSHLQHVLVSLPADTRVSSHADTRTDGKINIQIDRQVVRQTVGQTDRPTVDQTDRQVRVRVSAKRSPELLL